jgi:hypothetical protein
MSEMVRSKRSDKAVQGHRQGLIHTARRGVRRAPSQAQAQAAPRRRDQGPLQDRALYNCHCGFIFEAAVSTSVGCPHCGDGQAW